jgi:hypothetical protein
VLYQANPGSEYGGQRRRVIDPIREGAVDNIVTIIGHIGLFVSTPARWLAA